VEHPQRPGADGKDGYNADEHSRADPAGPHGGHFAVGGHAAEPDQDATSTPIGRVMVNVVGRVKRKISATLGRGALLRTTNSSSRPRSRMKMMKVNSATPNRACEMTSFRM